MKKKQQPKNREERFPARWEEDREFESRDFEEKPPARDMFAEDPLDVPGYCIPHGKEYKWGRRSVDGEEDIGRQVDLVRFGWVPVPASRHPEMNFEGFFGRRVHSDGYIEYKGLVLCERDKAIGDREREEHRKRHHQAMYSMPGLNNFHSSNPVINRTKIGFGRNG